MELRTTKLSLKIHGEYFGALGDFEYNIGDKLYEFAIINYEDFDKLKAMYTQLIELVCRAKEADTEDENMDCLFKMFQIVRACLEFSPYTHFYTQVLIDLIVKTYNFNAFRTDLLFKSQISVFIENSKYTPNEIYEQIEENQYTIELILYEWTKKKEEMTKNIVIIYIKILKKLAEKLVL